MTYLIADRTGLYLSNRKMIFNPYEQVFVCPEESGVVFEPPLEEYETKLVKVEYELLKVLDVKIELNQQIELSVLKTNNWED